MSGFRALLEAGDLEGTLASIERLDAHGKKAALAESLACCDLWWKSSLASASQGSSTTWTRLWAGSEEQRTCAALAALVLGEPAVLAKRLPDGNDGTVAYGVEALPALRRFRPSWLGTGGIDVLLEGHRVQWELITALREAGLCPQPRGEHYALQVMTSTRRWRGKTRRSSRGWTSIRSSSAKTCH